MAKVAAAGSAYSDHHDWIAGYESLTKHRESCSTIARPSVTDRDRVPKSALAVALLPSSPIFQRIQAKPAPFAGRRSLTGGLPDVGTARVFQGRDSACPAPFPAREGSAGRLQDAGVDALPELVRGALGDHGDGELLRGRRGARPPQYSPTDPAPRRETAAPRARLVPSATLLVRRRARARRSRRTPTLPPASPASPKIDRGCSRGRSSDLRCLRAGEPTRPPATARSFEQRENTPSSG